MDLYDTINAIDQGESKGTFKKLGEVKAKKRAEEKVVENQKNDAAAKIQRLVRKAAKKYFLVDVILYRSPDEDDVKSKTKFTAVKQKVIKKYGDVFIQYAKVQLSVKAPRVFPPNLLDKLISSDLNQEEFNNIIEILMTNEEFNLQIELIASTTRGIGKERDIQTILSDRVVEYLVIHGFEGWIDQVTFAAKCPVR
jgi:hypothetical protein